MTDIILIGNTTPSFTYPNGQIRFVQTSNVEGMKLVKYYTDKRIQMQADMDSIIEPYRNAKFHRYKK